MNLPLPYIIDTIYKYTRKPIYKKTQKVYNFSCPICGEGKSKNRKRGYFIINKNQFFCQNEQRSWSPLKWIMEVTGDSYYTVTKEASEYESDVDDVLRQYEDRKKEVKFLKHTSSLPNDSINLLDDTQTHFYRDDRAVKAVLSYIKQRRLNVAINRCKTFYISLNDKIHKNRLCIPFFDENGKIIFYQTRALFEKDEEFGKYLSKVDADKSVFGIDKIDSEFPHILIFEGPIDSMFVKNGVAICGLVLTELQKKQLTKYPLHKKIWVLDNQLDNEDVKKKYQDLIEQGETIVIWPNKFKEKDLNEICVKYKLNKISPQFLIKNSFNGLNASIKLKTL